MWTDRTKILIGQEGVDKLSASHIAIVGIGGVGGYACLMLARAGIGNLTLIDFDKVSETNINRQIVANTKTIGKLKTEVAKEMIKEINPDCNVQIYSCRFCENFAETFFKNKFDYVIDAIDSVKDKTDLICCCKNNKINIISAMGAGNRIGLPNFKVVDIYKTFNDGLAKTMRKKLREREIESLDVVTCEESATKSSTDNAIGSISYYPAMCGCVLGAFVINKILN